MRKLKALLLVATAVAAFGSKQGLAADKPQGTPYSITLSNLECGNFDCLVAIPAVPAGKVLVIQHLAGIAFTAEDSPFVRGQITASATLGSETQTLHVFVMNRIATPAPSSVFYHVNIPMLAFVKVGAQDARILVFTGAGGIISMTISGYLMDL